MWQLGRDLQGVPFKPSFYQCLPTATYLLLPEVKEKKELNCKPSAEVTNSEDLRQIRG